MSKFNVETHSYIPWQDEKDISQAISKYMIESAYTCAPMHWRVNVKVKFSSNIDYEFEFSSGGAVTTEELEIIDKKDRLKVEFYEVFLGEIGLPDVKLRTAEITLLVKEDDGTRNKAVEASLYRTFAANFIRAISLFPKRLFKGRCIQFDKEYVY